MMNLLDRLALEKPLLLSVTTGSPFTAFRLPAGSCPERWNLEAPGRVVSVSGTCFEDGADIVLTNTYGGSVIRLADFGLGERCDELNREAAGLALSVKPQGSFVLGSIGPTGKEMEPFGALSEAEVTASYAVQAEALAASGVDGFFLQGFSDLNEILCAIRAVEGCCELPLIASMNFTDTPAGFYTERLLSLEDALDLLQAAGAIAVGAGCSGGLHTLVRLGKRMRSLQPELRLFVLPVPERTRVRKLRNHAPNRVEQLPDLWDDITAIKPSLLACGSGSALGSVHGMRERVDSFYCQQE